MNFHLHYTPAKYISLNESTMAFKGRVKFLQFNPSKPNKFHIKLFMVSEHLSGYISGFSVYTGKTCNELVTENANLDPYCSITAKTVMGLPILGCVSSRNSNRMSRQSSMMIAGQVVGCSWRVLCIW